VHAHEDSEEVTISIVIPVYRGEDTLPELVAEIEPLTRSSITPAGRRFRIAEVLLVWDRGPGQSDEILRRLATQHAFVRPIWLSRNFGQHPATLAGMTSSNGTWIVTMDEDGQHDPQSIGNLLDAAYTERAELIYAAPTNRPPHPFFRNIGSKISKWLFVNVLASNDFEEFNSFRLVLGEVGRSTAAYTGPGVYLDVALSWVVARVSTCPVHVRREGRPAGNYTTRKLLSHFGRLVVSSGTRPLAFVSIIGLIVFLLGIVWSIWILWQAASGTSTPAGWTSTFVGLLLIGGFTLFALGIIAQYIRVTSDAALGRPLYVVVSDPDGIFGSVGEANRGD
jgi:glycosyltransferase involved in cell wall biosynthesis